MSLREFQLGRQRWMKDVDLLEVNTIIPTRVPVAVGFERLSVSMLECFGSADARAESSSEKKAVFYGQLKSTPRMKCS